jgi:hypothetical protein
MTGMTRLPASLLASLFDDAALFPPGNADMDVAVPAHARHRNAWYGSLVGPFVCPDARLGQLKAAMEATSHEISVSVVVTNGPEAISSVLGETADRGLRLVGIEVPLGPGGRAGERAKLAVRAITEQPIDFSAYVEVPRGPESHAVLDALAGTPVAAKFRTGGLTPEAFPTEEEVASFLLACSARSIAFKCTAGLHRMVRHRAEPEGYERHGVANLLVATAACRAGASRVELIAILAETDEERVMTALEGAGSARPQFASLGTCSVEEPVEDLVRLGVLEPPAAGDATVHASVSAS